MPTEKPERYVGIPPASPNPPCEEEMNEPHNVAQQSCSPPCWEGIAWIRSWAAQPGLQLSPLPGSGLPGTSPCATNVQSSSGSQNPFAAEMPPQEWWNSGGFVPGLQLKGRTCLLLVKTPLESCDYGGLRLWLTSEKWCTTEVEAEESLWSTKPFWKVPLT